MSVDFFERHVMTDLRIVRCGRRRLIPVSALETWLEAHASKVLERTAAAHTRQSVNGRADSPTAVLVHTPPKPS